MNKTLKKIPVTTLFLTPFLAYAATVETILGQIRSILNLVAPILMVLATIVFLWGIVRYVTAGGDEDKLKEGRQFIIFGLVGLFIMIAAWGIVLAVVNQFGLQTPSSIPGGVPHFIQP